MQTCSSKKTPEVDIAIQSYTKYYIVWILIVTELQAQDNFQLIFFLPRELQAVLEVAFSSTWQFLNSIFRIVPFPIMSFLIIL